MGCIYKIGNKIFANQLQLNDYLLNQEAIPKSSDIVFSVEPTSQQKITAESIASIENQANLDKDRSKFKEHSVMTEDGVDFDLKYPYIGVTKFLQGLTNEQDQLFVPEFLEENYWPRRFEDWEKGQYKDTEIEILGFNENNPAVAVLATQKEKQEEFKKKIRETWKGYGELGTDLHNVMQALFSKQHNGKYVIQQLENSTSGLTFLKEYLRKYKGVKDNINNDVLNDMITYASDLYQWIKDEFGESAMLYPEFTVTGKLATLAEGKQTDTLLGIIDLLVIDKDGYAHVFDYKTSTKSYSDYNSAKKRTFKYQLATYGRLLKKGNVHVNAEKYSYSIIPFVMKGFKKGANGKWTCDRVDADKRGIKDDNGVWRVTPVEELKVYEDTKLLDNLDIYVPEPFVKTEEVANLFEYTSAVMKEMMPTYSELKMQSDEAITKEIEKNGGYEQDPNTLLYSFKVKGSYMDPITAKTQEELFKKVKEFKEKLPLRRGQFTKQVIKGLKEGIKLGTSDVEFIEYQHLNEDPESTTSWLRDQLGEYCSKQYEVLDYPQLESYGIILILDKVNKMVNVVKISPHKLKYQHKFVGDRVQLTGAHQSDLIELTKSNSLMLRSAQGNIELVEAMVALNGVHGIFEKNQGYTIGKMQVINPKYGTGISASNKELLYSFKQLSKIKSVNDAVGVNYFEGEKPVIKMAETYEVAQASLNSIIQDGMDSSWQVNGGFKMLKDTFTELGVAITSKSRDKMLNALQELEKKLRTDYKSGRADIQNVNQSKFHEKHVKVYNEVIMAISALKGMKFRQQLNDHDKYIENWNVFTKGLGGTYIDNPGNMSSETLNIVTKEVMSAYQNVREDMQEPTNKIRTLVENLKKAKGFNWLEERTIGNQVNLYKGMFSETKADLVAKNPWDPNSLIETEAEREFLKYFLTEINKKRFNYSKDQFDRMIANNDINYFRIPLAMASSKSKISTEGLLDNFKSAIKSVLHPKKLVRKWVKQAVKKAEGFTKAQEKNGSDRLFEMSDRFSGGDDPTERQRLIQDPDFGPNRFEHDLESVLLQYEFAHSVKKNMDQAFPMIKAAMIHLSLQGSDQNTEFRDDKNFITEYIKNKIKGETIIDPKWQATNVIMSKLKTAASFMTLAVSPVQVMYQSIDGIFQAIKLRIRNPDGTKKFSLDNLRKSAAYTLKELGHFSDKPTKLQLINEYFALNDMDMNQYAQHLQSDQHGIWNMSNFMFKFASRPDFYNRMIIFQSQMRADGSWDAYSEKDGKLVYDWKLDKRFSKYATNDKSNIAEYNKQKGLYYAVAQQLVNEHTKNADGTDFKIGDALPKSHTNQEIEGYKQLADNIYGYYSHEKKSLIQSTMLGAMWLQMRTYWSAKKNQYLQPGGVKLQGKMEQYVEDGVPYFQKLDENGNMVPTTEDTGIPLYRWKGRFEEGIMLTIAQILKPNEDYGFNPIKNFKEMMTKTNDPDILAMHKANIKQFVVDMLMFLLFAGLLSGLLKDWAESEKKHAKETGELQDALVATAAVISTRAVTSAFGDFNALDSITSPLTNWTPFAVVYSSKVIGNWWSVMFGDTKAYTAAINTSSVGKQIKPMIDYIKPDTEDEDENS